MDPFYFDLKLQSLGKMVPLNLFYPDVSHMDVLRDPGLDWKPYNKTKKNFNRFGLSLTSLKGETDGLIDLTSLTEYNEAHGTSYNEMSFRTPTPYWETLSPITHLIEGFKPHLGRSHILRLDTAGFFPPHRDLGDSIRLICFLGTSPMDCHFIVDDQKMFFEPDRFYYVNTRLTHSLVSFNDNSFICVLNVAPSADSYGLIIDNLESR